MKVAPYIVIIILVIFAAFQRERIANLKNDQVSDTAYVNNTIYDTVYDTVVIIKDNYIPRIDSVVVRDSVFRDVDTLAILSSYYELKFINDTILHDTSGIIIINDIITENSIKERSFIIELYPRYITKTKFITEKPKFELHGGIGVGRSIEQFGLSANILLRTRNANIYTISYDVINKDIYLTYYFKIW